MDFEALIVKWNNGIKRGAQTNFANKIGVAKNTVSQWIKFRVPPGEEIRARVASKLGVTVDQLMSAIRDGARARFQNVEYARASDDALPKPLAVREPPGAYGEDSIALLIGRIDQLTRQVADVQERCGALDHQIKQMWEKMGTREPKTEGAPQESGGTRKKNNG